MTEAPIVRKNYKKQSPYIHRAYTYLRQNIMKLILLLPLRLSKCTRFLLHFSCCIVMRNSTIYLLLLLLVRRTIKYIKIIVFPRYTQCSNVFCEVGFTLVNISFVFFSAFNVFETGNAICAELQQIMGG